MIAQRDRAQSTEAEVYIYVKIMKWPVDQIDG